jgi:hypothetical protein
MTLAEIFLLIVGITGIYHLLRPLQRSLETYLTRKFARNSRARLPTIDVTEFKSYGSRKKEDHHQ